MNRILLAALVAIPATALANGKPQPGEKHDPALFLDPTSIWINLTSQSDSGYGAHAWFRIEGGSTENDRVRLDWKQGAKVIGTAKCKTVFDLTTKEMEAACDLDNNLKAKGRVDLELVYTDDKTDTEYLVQKLTTDVKWWKGIGTSQYWGILPDELLAAAFIRYWPDDAPSNRSRVPMISMWTTGNVVGDVQLRCTVDGQPIPDIKGSADRTYDSAQEEIESEFTSPTANRNYSYNHINIDPGFKWGKKEKHDLHDPEKELWAVDHPGKWECKIRRDGNVFREVTFSVDQDGKMTGAFDKQMRLPDDVSMIEMKIPKDNGIEKRLRPDAMKKSIGFGMPWPSSPEAKAAQAAFPPAMGTPDK